MACASPIATVLVLPDLKPLAPRLLAALAHLPGRLAEALHQQAETLGRAVVFTGTPQEARRIEGQLRTAGLATSLNLSFAPVAIAAGEG